jgi:hypothetical protein
MSGNIIQNVKAITSDAEKATISGQDNARVFDASNEKLLMEILQELRKMNLQLSIITDEEITKC